MVMVSPEIEAKGSKTPRATTVGSAVIEMVKPDEDWAVTMTGPVPVTLACTMRLA